jgi:hypothetical protein
LINNLPVSENRPNDVSENIPSNQLVHRYVKGKWIRPRELKELARKKYYINGKGITFFDVIAEYRCSKPKAQLRLKNACKEKIDKNGKKSSILFTLDNERTNPQQYYPSCIKATIIENKRNRPIDPTGANYNNKTSSHALHNAIENKIVASFLFQLYLLPWQILNMHNIHMRTIIDKNHYEEIKIQPCSYKNKTKIHRELIGLRVVVYKFNKNGSIEIEIGCSKNPFPLETSYDVFNFFVFLGQVKYTLANILHDPRDRIVPSVDNWILKYCDFNKDIELDDGQLGQLMDLNIQIKYAGEAFRLYVKNLEDRFVLRGEKVMKVNQPITTFLNDSILNPFHLIENKFTELYDIIGKNYLDLKDRIDGKK